jgi:hypothetical protein
MLRMRNAMREVMAALLTAPGDESRVGAAFEGTTELAGVAASADFVIDRARCQVEDGSASDIVRPHLPHISRPGEETAVFRVDGACASFEHGLRLLISTVVSRHVINRGCHA